VIGAWAALRWHERTITSPPTAIKAISGRENLAAGTAAVIGHQSGHRSKQDSHSSTLDLDQAPILGGSGSSDVIGINPSWTLGQRQLYLVQHVQPLPK
jgi:hypothetical protein